MEAIRNYKHEEILQDGDLLITIATSTQSGTWAFSHSGKHVQQLMGATKRPYNQDSRIDLCYMALIASLRSLVPRDVANMKTYAGDHVSIIVNSDCNSFIH